MNDIPKEYKVFWGEVCLDLHKIIRGIIVAKWNEYEPREVTIHISLTRINFSINVMFELNCRSKEFVIDTVKNALWYHLYNNAFKGGDE